MPTAEIAVKLDEKEMRELRAAAPLAILTRGEVELVCQAINYGNTLPAPTLALRDKLRVLLESGIEFAAEGPLVSSV